MSEFNKYGVSADLIKQSVSQIEKLEEEKAEISSQIKDTYDLAKSQGLSVSVLKQLIKLRKKKKEDVMEEEELLELYRQALEQ